jgi:hypothetical protein
LLVVEPIIIAGFLTFLMRQTSPRHVMCRLELKMKFLSSNENLDQNFTNAAELEID